MIPALGEHPGGNLNTLLSKRKKKRRQTNEEYHLFRDNGCLGDNFDATTTCLNEIRGALKNGPYLRRVYQNRLSH